jgi:dCMP deaminase
MRTDRKATDMPTKTAARASARSASRRSKRVGWDEYFMNIAKVVSTRATCDRKLVGAVIVRDRTILSTGYNGSIRGLDHCDEVGHLMENDHCVATIHAEANAILQAAKNGVSLDGGTMYTTASPCWPCFKLIANAGLKRICFGEFYRDERIFDVAKKVGIELVKLEPSPLDV